MLQELADDHVGIETNRVRVGANERPQKNPGWPVRDVAVLERVEQRRLDLRLLGDGRERYVLLFSLLAQSRTKTVGHEAHLGSRGAVGR